MNFLLLMGFVIFVCILLSNIINKTRIPSLLFFIILGMIFGEDGLLRIPFNDYNMVNIICSISLIFIMFYGGFGTNIKTAKPVLLPSILMSTIGVILTALGTAFFAHFILHVEWLESLLIGSVISSTDAATVFNILKSQKLALKYHTDSLLEVESGSNDPMSYMLTAISITLLTGKSIFVPLLFAEQIIIGVGFGLILGLLTIKLLHQNILTNEQSHTILLFSIMLLSFSIPNAIGGNGYLSVYLSGIVIGNSKLPQKKYLLHFFDVLTNVSQVVIFFLLGLLVTPSKLGAVILPAFVLMIILTFIVRPIICIIILAPQKKSLKQILLVAFAGLRGAASIVFAISAVISGVNTHYNLYNLVFCMVLISIAFQGTLLPLVSKKLKMIDEASDIRKTFTDYQENSDISFIKIHITNNHSWIDQKIMDLKFPNDLLVAMIVRNNKVLIPNGSTKLIDNDLLVLAARTFENREHFTLSEIVVTNKYVNLALKEIPHTNSLVILIKRGMETIIPTGNTILKRGDILVLTELKSNQ